MTLLHSITLANTRKFAEDVRIDFGPGATILLAPNGTGKTTVFEAIELALTGNISRLSANLLPFIRETKSQSVVRLDFGDELIRTATLNRGQMPTLSGDLEELLGGVERNGVPYLLRLTHLLDQHDRRWFVEAESGDAGNQLAALPIGKDGVKASGVLTSAKKALSEKRKEVERRLDDVMSRQAKWQELLTARANSTIDFGRPLIPIAELSNGLKTLAVVVDAKVSDGMAVPVLMDSFAEIMSLMDQKYELVQARTEALVRCDSLLAEFQKTSKTLEQSQVLLAQLQTTKNEREEGLANAQGRLDEMDLALITFQNSRRQLVELQQRVEALTSAKIQETSKEEALIHTEKMVKAAGQTLLVATTNHQTAQQAAALHRQLSSRADGLKRAENEFATAREMLTRWIADLEEINMLDTAIKGHGAEIEKTAGCQRNARDDLKIRQQEAEDAQNTFDVISQASDVIREAVSAIALHLPKDQNDCPLCGQVHGAMELQRRMSNALLAMDPALVPAAERVEASRRIVTEAEKALEDLQKSLSGSRVEVAKAEERRAECLSEIEEIRSLSIFVDCDVASAPTAITTKMTEIETLRQNLIADQSAAPACPTPESLSGLAQDVHIAKSTLESANVRLDEVKAALQLAQSHRRMTEESMVELKVFDNLVPQLVEIETNIMQAMTSVEVARAERDSRRVACDEINAEVLRGESLVSRATEGLSELQMRWSSIPLDGNPAAETLALAKLQLSETQNKIGHSRKELQNIRTELARWEAAESFHKAQGAVSEFCGDCVEEAFTDRLQSELAAAKSEVTRISKGTSALDSFSTNLKKKCDEANQRVNAIVPLWKSLLNRVVREPRFSETNLEVFNHYNKPHAKTTVSLNGTQTPVNAVASEAQMTDLQLTFLLAMAQQHPWSPWRALLLDDPTQHHDLVHASAVFDLLRDYIADYGFQVVIATHDALQARFFMRKLENDGIESRLWTLKPTDAGVNAFRER